MYKTEIDFFDGSNLFLFLSRVLFFSITQHTANSHSKENTRHLFIFTGPFFIFAKSIYLFSQDMPTHELQEIESRPSEFSCDEKNPKSQQAVKGITNEELLLGCAAVYMSSLGEVDDETALGALTTEDSKTLLVALTIGTAKQHVFARLQRYEDTGLFVFSFKILVCVFDMHTN